MLKLIDENDNAKIEDILIKSIIENNCEIDEKTMDKIKKISDYTEKRVAEQNVLKFGNLFKDNIEEIVPAQRQAVNRIVSDNIENLCIERGLVSKNDIIEKLANEIIDGKYSGYVVQNKDYILEQVSKVLDNNEILKNLNRTPFSILKKCKNNLKRGWIRNILNAPNELTKEQLENLREKLGVNFETESISQVKEGKNLEELYKIFIDKEIPEIISYEKIEMLFGKIQPPFSANFQKFFGKNKDEILRNPEFCLKMGRIHNIFEDLLNNSPVLNGKELTVENILEVYNLNFINIDIYGSIYNDEIDLAKYAKTYQYSVEEFEKVRKIFEITKRREETTIPPITTELTGNYRGRTLNINDVLGIFVGEFTSCCQVIDDAGESAMIHSVTEKNGNVFVIEELDNEGNPFEIIAQSWVWRNKDRLCFDNIELKKDYTFSKELKDIVLKLYEEAGKNALLQDEKYLKKQLDEKKISQEIYDKWVLKEVTVGLRYTKLKSLYSYEEAKTVLTKEMRKDYLGNVNGGSVYSDAKEQVIIAKMSDEKRNEIKSRQDNILKSEEIVEPEWYNGNEL